MSKKMEFSEYKRQIMTELTDGYKYNDVDACTVLSRNYTTVQCAFNANSDIALTTAEIVKAHIMQEGGKR
jgi:hypothetical protein